MASGLSSAPASAAAPTCWQDLFTDTSPHKSLGYIFDDVDDQATRSVGADSCPSQLPWYLTTPQSSQAFAVLSNEEFPLWRWPTLPQGYVWQRGVVPNGDVALLEDKIKKDFQKDVVITWTSDKFIASHNDANLQAQNFAQVAKAVLEEQEASTAGGCPHFSVEETARIFPRCFKGPPRKPTPDCMKLQRPQSKEEWKQFEKEVKELVGRNKSGVKTENDIRYRYTLRIEVGRTSTAYTVAYILDQLGFFGKFSFIYVPQDQKNKTKCKVFCFVVFTSPEIARDAKEKLGAGVQWADSLHTYHDNVKRYSLTKLEKDMSGFWPTVFDVYDTDPNPFTSSPVQFPGFQNQDGQPAHQRGGNSNGNWKRNWNGKKNGR